MVVGEASIIIMPDTAGFAAALEAETDGAFGGFRENAKTAGKDAGRDMRDGLNTDQLAMDLGEAGAMGGRDLRENVGKETDKLGEDMGRDGEKGGESLSKGMSSGLGKLANLVSNTGLPLGGLSGNLEKSAKAAESAGKSTGTLAESLGGMAGPLAVAGVGLLVGAGYAIHLAEGMQQVEAAIKGATGQSVAEVKKIGGAFIDTAGKSEFSGEEIGKAYAEVAGQLKATEGRALGVAEATRFMGAASDLATAKQIGIGEATATTAQVMQAFGLHTSEAAHVTDVLYSASNATGTSVEGLGAQIARMHSKLGETAGSVGNLASLIVDMTEHGITGRAAVSALSTGLSTLEKSSNAVSTATGQQNAAFAALTPSLKAIARGYLDGSVTSKEFKKQTENLPAGQEALVKQFTKANEAVETAKAKYSEMGVQAFNAQGKFVGMGSIVDQLYPRFKKMSEAQQIAAATTLFGAGAAKQMIAIINAGPEAFNKATASVEKHGAAQKAAEAQSKTLAVEMKTLEATFIDLGTKIGTVLIPVVTLLGNVLIKLIPIVESVVGFIKSHWVLLSAVFTAPIIVAVAGWKLLESKILSVTSTIVGAVKSAWSTLEDTTSSVVQAVVKFFEGLPGKVVGAVKSLPGELLALGEHLIEGLVHGIESGIGKLESILHHIASLPGKLLSDVLKIKSPSKVTERHGLAIAEGLVEGMRKGEGPVADAASALGKAALEKLWVEAGGSKSAANLAASIALAESGGNPMSTDNDSNGTVDRGLWQINSIHGSQSTYNEKANARSAVELSSGGRDFSPWVTYNTGAYKKFLGQPGGGAAGASPAVEQKAALAQEIAAQERAFKDWAARTTAAAADGSKAVKAAAAQEVAERRAALTQIIAGEKAGLSVQQATQKAELQKQTADQKAGTSALNKMLEGIHSGSLKTLEKDLEKVHQAGLAKIEKDLDGDHKTALAKLSAELVKVHREALAKQATLEAAARAEAEKKADEERAASEKTAAEAAEKATIDQINRQATIASQISENAAQAITDATKITLDKQAEQGLAGTAEIAANLQTVFDEVTQNADREIGAAKLAQDQAAGSGGVAEAQAAAHTAQVEGEAKVREAEAQAREEVARANASSSTTAPEAAAGLNIENLTINAAGMSSGELLGELGWSLHTGQLPIAKPVPA